METITPRLRPEGPEDRAHRTGLITGLVIGVIGGGIVGGIVGAMATERGERGPALAIGDGGASRRVMGITERPVEERIPPAPSEPAPQQP